MSDIAKLNANIITLTATLGKFLDHLADKNGAGEDGKERRGRGGGWGRLQSGDSPEKVKKETDHAAYQFGEMANAIERNIAQTKLWFQFTKQYKPETLLNKTFKSLDDMLVNEAQNHTKAYNKASKRTLDILKESDNATRTSAELHAMSAKHLVQVAKAGEIIQNTAEDSTVTVGDAFKELIQHIQELSDKGLNPLANMTIEERIKIGKLAKSTELLGKATDETKDGLTELVNKVSELSLETDRAIQQTTRRTLDDMKSGYVEAAGKFTSAVTTGLKVIAGSFATEVITKSPNVISSQLQAGLTASLGDANPLGDGLGGVAASMGISLEKLTQTIASQKMNLRTIAPDGSTDALDGVQTFKGMADSLKRVGIYGEEAAQMSAERLNTMVDAGIRPTQKSFVDLTETAARAGEIFGMQYAESEKFVSELAKETFMLSRLSGVSDENKRNEMIRDEIESRFKLRRAMGYNIEQIMQQNREMNAKKTAGLQSNIESMISFNLGSDFMKSKGYLPDFRESDKGLINKVEAGSYDRMTDDERARADVVVRDLKTGYAAFVDDISQKIANSDGDINSIAALKIELEQAQKFLDKYSGGNFADVYTEGKKLEAVNIARDTSELTPEQAMAATMPSAEQVGSTRATTNQSADKYEPLLEAAETIAGIKASIIGNTAAVAAGTIATWALTGANLALLGKSALNWLGNRGGVTAGGSGSGGSGGRGPGSRVIRGAGAAGAAFTIGAGLYYGGKYLFSDDDTATPEMTPEEIETRVKSDIDKVKNHEDSFSNAHHLTGLTTPPTIGSDTRETRADGMYRYTDSVGEGTVFSSLGMITLPENVIDDLRENNVDVSSILQRTAFDPTGVSKELTLRHAALNNPNGSASRELEIMERTRLTPSSDKLDINDIIRHLENSGVDTERVLRRSHIDPIGVSNELRMRHAALTDVEAYDDIQYVSDIQESSGMNMLGTAALVAGTTAVAGQAGLEHITHNKLDARYGTLPAETTKFQKGMNFLNRLGGPLNAALSAKGAYDNVKDDDTKTTAEKVGNVAGTGAGAGVGFWGGALAGAGAGALFGTKLAAGVALTGIGAGLAPAIIGASTAVGGLAGGIIGSEVLGTVGGYMGDKFGSAYDYVKSIAPESSVATAAMLATNPLTVGAAVSKSGAAVGEFVSDKVSSAYDTFVESPFTTASNALTFANPITMFGATLSKLIQQVNKVSSDEDGNVVASEPLTPVEQATLEIRDANKVLVDLTKEQKVLDAEKHEELKQLAQMGNTFAESKQSHLQSVMGSFTMNT